MILIYLVFLVSLTIIILDVKSDPRDRKLVAWNTGRIKMILASWTMLLGSSVAIIIQIAHSL
jgi:hypothetical protein